MKWAFVTNQEEEFLLNSWSYSEFDRGDGEMAGHYSPQVTLELKPAGTICCLPVYDGALQFLPPTDYVVLKQVPDDAQIGDEGYGQ